MGRVYTILDFIKAQYASLPSTTVDLTGRTVLVTGANTGLGREAARQLLQMKPRKLIMTSRSLIKGQEAMRWIIERAQETRPDVVEVWELDLANFESTKAFARQCNQLERLDIALLNAGAEFLDWSVTKDGYETSLQVNVISTGLLALLLLPLLQRTTQIAPALGLPTLKPHLVIVASDIHYWAKFRNHAAPKPITALNDEAQFDGPDRYSVLDIFLAREISGLSIAKDVTVSSVNPGFCYSELRRQHGSLFLRVFERLFCRTEAVGAYNYTAAALKHYPSGSFISNCVIEEPSVFVGSIDGYDCQARVWAELRDMWTKLSPEVAEIIA